MLMSRVALATSLFLSLTTSVLAQQSPAGLWVTYDAQTNQASSHIRVDQSGDTLSGSVDQILDPAKADARCVACDDERKDQPIAGMMLFRNVKAKADEAQTWDGGEILDPRSGRTYKVRIRLINNGNTLEVRGYRGNPMFGRTQLWQRYDATQTAAAAAEPSTR